MHSGQPAVQKVHPFLWFNDQAEEAANFYVSVFPNSRVTAANRYGEGRPGRVGSVMSISFEIDGQAFTALNGGPHFHFSEAVSFVIDCADQAEVDLYWIKLGEGGQPGRCGWLKDRFGLSWQVVPRALSGLIGGPDRAGAGRATAALMQMTRLEVDKLQAAYDGDKDPG